jgi:hypothetical protein
MERAKVVWTNHKDELLKNPNVLGVGISSSVDSPGDAALLVYVKHGVAHDFVPAEVDGLRTRIRETGKFTAGRDSDRPTSNGCKVHALLTAGKVAGKL